VAILSVAPNRLWCITAINDDRLARLANDLPREVGCTTQLGHSHVRLRIGGPAARHLLTQEIAVDLAPKAFPAGRIARTSLHHVPVLLHCLEPAGDGLFDLFLPYTYAASTWEYLLDLAEGSGYAIEPAASLGHEGN
jgi:sarcosine oxidase subunit gamma